MHGHLLINRGFSPKIHLRTAFLYCSHILNHLGYIGFVGFSFYLYKENIIKWNLSRVIVEGRRNVFKKLVQGQVCMQADSGGSPVLLEGRRLIVQGRVCAYSTRR